MVTIRNADNTKDINLTAVDHVSDAESAAQKLWESAHEAAREHGGAVFLFTPDDRGDEGWAVFWDRGPEQWADAYVVSEGADAMGFVAQAENGDTVVFVDTN